MRLKGMGLLAMAACALSGQSSPCDPRLVGLSSSPYNYRLRGSRCEGIYIQEVAGAPLSIVSWTAAFDDYDLKSREPLRLQWEPLKGGESVRLRAQGLRRSLYYRMDAQLPAGTKLYEWPTDLLAAVRIPRDEIGVVGWADGVVGGTRREIYLPLRIAQGRKPAPAVAYHLVLLPGTELKEVFVTLEGPGGAPVLRKGEPLGYGYYPAERPVDVPVSVPREAGIYRLEIGATHRSGGASTIDLWFYHTGKG